MGKRLTDANKWDDPWYSELPPEYKLAWDYICDKCDAVGVWKPSEKHLYFNTGAKDLSTFLSACSPARIRVLPNGNWWIVKFCDFQYGPLNEAGCYGKKEDGTTFVRNKPHLSYINLLKKHSLWIDYTRAIHSPKETDKEKDKDKETENSESESLSDIHLAEVFDEVTLETFAMAFRQHDVPDQLEKFKAKIRGSPESYRHRDNDGLRKAFHYQLQNSRPEKKRGSNNPYKLQ